ncbi:MAG: amidohydrolase, partial [Blastocatellia bacterium]|nr:amidohydrolase [Blastocatellia bacterium]
VKEDELIVEAREVAKKIDEFLIEREESVLSKLIALGGSSEEESFEVQIKAKIDEPNSVIDALMKNEIDILYERHYRQHDAYFFFEDETAGNFALPRRRLY